MPDAFQQIWQGDSIELCKKFKPGRVDCVITDPPFGVNNQSNMAVTQAGKQYARKIANDENPEQAIAVFQSAFNSLMPAIRADADIYVFTSYQVLKEWLVMCDDFFGHYGFKRKAVIWWEKDGPGMGDLEVPWGMGSEAILFFRRGRRPKTVKRRNSTLHIPQIRPDDLIHPHEKPLALLEMLIKASSAEGEFIVDPFGGSGSLARAARQCNRSAVCIELDEHNAQLATRALENASVGLF